MLRQGTCIGFLPDAGCGLIYADVEQHGQRIVFVHFRDIQAKSGWQGLVQGERVEYVLDRQKGELFHRACVATGESIGSGEDGFVQVLQDHGSLLHFCSVEDIEKGISAVFENLQLVVTGDIPDGWHLPEQYRNSAVIFSQCCWSGKANFSGWNVQGCLVFLGCTFMDSFTLKEAYVNGKVHMEGCDFSGSGGASFRGLEAEALYLDFGVKGPRDMVWLNEVYIHTNIVIGGEFEGAIQVMRLQDNRVVTATAKKNLLQGRACFEQLYLGKEFYKSQNINRTILQGHLELSGLCFGEVITIENVELRDLDMIDLSHDVSVSCLYSKVYGSVNFGTSFDKSCSQYPTAQVKLLDFQGSYIEGHLSIKYAQISDSLNLDDATIERVMRFHQVKFIEAGGLKMARLSVNRLVMDDFSTLYGEPKQASFWNAPRFNMLYRERQMQTLSEGPDVELVQEYVLLKNLLSQEGQLRLEDESFYNMRRFGHWYQDMGMLMMNYVFGWGVRLQNILVSVLTLIIFYAYVYHSSFASLSILDSIQLSIQSMFMAFFGQIEPAVVAGGRLSWVVLSESVLGVIFITVFVGAYVRKLLR